MLALLLISIAGFFALFFAMLTLLRHAAATGRTSAASKPATSRTAPAPASPATTPALRNKRPDWRFLVRDGRRPFPSAHTRKPPSATGSTRADWAHYNKDLGDLNDPYQAAPSPARRA